MGEKSKTTGERGETIAYKLLERLGWLAFDGFDIACLNPSHKGSGGNKRNTHGIDGYVELKNPLDHERIDRIFLSVKASETQNQFSESELRRYYREHVEAIFCGTTNADCQLGIANIGSPLSGLIVCTNIQDYRSGQLSVERDTSISYHPRGNYEKLVLLSNNSITFIHSIVEHMLKNYLTYNFVYHTTGHNYKPKELQPSGKVLPLSMLYAGVIMMEGIKDSVRHLCVFTRDNISLKSVVRLIWLTLRHCGGFSTMTILINGFDHSNDLNTIKRAKNLFLSQDRLRDIRFANLNLVSPLNLLSQEFSKEITSTYINKSSTNDTDLSVELQEKLTLPYGRILETLLFSPRITELGLKRFYESLGITRRLSTKSLSIRDLATSLLSSDDLDILQEMLAEAEDKPKYSRKIVKTAVDAEQSISALRSLSNIDYNSQLPTNISYSKSPNVTSESENNYTIFFELSEENSNKDFVFSKRDSKGAINITLVDNNFQITRIHTSPASKRVCNDLLELIYSNFKSNGAINETPLSIRYASFTNNNSRVLFLTCLMNSNLSDLRNIQIVEIDFSPDPTYNPFPESLKPFVGKVKRLSLTGEGFESIEFLNSEMTRPAIKLGRVKYTANFDFENVKSFVIIEIQFENIFRSNEINDNSELLIRCDVPKKKGNVNKKAIKDKLIATLSTIITDSLYSYFVSNNDFIERGK